MLHARTGVAPGAILVIIGFPALSTASTLNVPGGFPTIQGCIDAAASGVDECVVAPGTYHETINFLGKAITLRSSGGRDVTTIDATGLGGSVVTCASGEGPNTVLDGFTITGGTETYDWWRMQFLGGGMFCHGSSSPTVTNCTFDRNMGSGMFNYGSRSSPTVSNCTFSSNTANAGGGMYNDRSSPTVSNCTFSSNTANVGGGMSNDFSSPTVTHCTFSGNTAYSSGGGMYNYRNEMTVTNSTFSGNTANYGGGMYNVESSNPTVADCTFSGNTAASGGGMYNWYYSSPTATNCILWGDAPDEIVNVHISTITIHFSDIQGGLPLDAIDGGGNMDIDPMFVRPPYPGPDGIWDGVDDDYGDLRLRAGSPCIDAGDPAFVAQPGDTDLDGHARVLCGRVDMGAYEFGIGNYDCNQAVNLLDFAAWPTCMTGPSTADTAVPHDPCSAFDFDGDSDIDLRDFSQMQRLIVVP